LDRERGNTPDGDSASRLLNGVHHIYNQINIGREMILSLSGKDSYDVDEVMEYALDMDHVKTKC
jgi:hypothetical protein